MFHDIPEPILQQMARLERIDARDRADGTPRLKRLRQIPPETGRFLALLLAGAPPGACVEVGTSAGYSALWLSLACRAADRRLTTFEILPEKAALARETLSAAGANDVVNVVEGDALPQLESLREIAFCFLDAEKEVYAACYERVVRNLVPGGWLAADNAINHREILQPVLERAHRDARVDALVVPIGKGVLLCRRN